MADQVPEYPESITGFISAGLSEEPSANRVLQFPRRFVELLAPQLAPEFVVAHLDRLLRADSEIPLTPIATLVIIAHPSPDLPFHAAMASHADVLVRLAALSAMTYDYDGKLAPTVVPIITDIATFALLRLSHIADPSAPSTYPAVRTLATTAPLPAAVAACAADTPHSSALSLFVSSLLARWLAPPRVVVLAGPNGISTSRLAAALLLSQLARTSEGAKVILTATVPLRGTAEDEKERGKETKASKASAGERVSFIDTVVFSLWRVRGIVMAHPPVSRGDDVGTPWQSLFENKLLDLVFQMVGWVGDALRLAPTSTRAATPAAAAGAVGGDGAAKEDAVGIDDANVASVSTFCSAKSRRRLLLVCVAILDAIARCEQWPGATRHAQKNTDISTALTHEPIQLLLCAIAGVVRMGAVEAREAVARTSSPANGVGCCGVPEGDVVSAEKGDGSPHAPDDAVVRYTVSDIKRDFERWGVYEVGASRAAGLAALGIPGLGGGDAPIGAGGGSGAGSAEADGASGLGLGWGYSVKRREERLAKVTVEDGGAAALISLPLRSGRGGGGSGGSGESKDPSDAPSASGAGGGEGESGDHQTALEPFAPFLRAALFDFGVSASEHGATPQSVVLLPPSGIAIARIALRSDASTSKLKVPAEAAADADPNVRNAAAVAAASARSASQKGPSASEDVPVWFAAVVGYCEAVSHQQQQ